MATSVLNPGGLATLNNWKAPVMPANAPGIVPQVYAGSTGSGSNQNVSTNNYGGYTPTTFQGGQSMPAYGTPEYNSLVGRNNNYISYGSSYDRWTSPSGSSSASMTPQVQLPSNTVVSATNLGTQAVAIPSSPSSGNYYGTSLGNNVGLGADPATGLIGAPDPTATTPTTPPPATTKSVSDRVKELMGLYKEQPSEADAYNRAQQQSGYDSALQQKNNTQSQINGITAKMNTDIINYRAAIAAEGGTAGGFGGVQDEISREATVKLLPLQAQLAIDQGNLSMAQQHLDTLFKIYTDDAKSAVDQYNKTVDVAYDLFNKDEQRIIEQNKADKASALDTLNTTISWQRKLGDQATDNGNRTLANEIYSLRPPTVGSSTYARDYAAYDAKLSQLASQMPMSAASIAANQKVQDTKDISQTLGTLLLTGNMPPSLVSAYGGSRNLAIAEADKEQMKQTGTHFDVSKAEQQYQAAKRFATSLNSTQMVRYQTLANSVVNTIDEVNNLAGEMKLQNIPLVNKVQLSAYINATGADSTNGQLAARYLSAVNSVKEEFANLANGGYAPTDAAWDLANKQINENYDVNKLNASLFEIQRVINYRTNALTNITAIMPGSGTQTQSSTPVTSGSLSSGITYTVE
jgi:hypothetical protein